MMLMPNPFVRFVLHARAELVPFTGRLYDYVLAANGLFVRAERPGLRALVPLAPCELRGLNPVEPYVELLIPRVPAALVAKALSLAVVEAGPDGEPREVLFHLLWRDGWRLLRPHQEQGFASVRPLGPALGSSYEQALVELHSHHGMRLGFSALDDEEETGFRLYAVLADIFLRPTLFARVSVYGYHAPIPAATVFELPEGVRDGFVEVDDES